MTNPFRALLLATSLSLSCMAGAADHGSKEEAVAMTQKAIAYMKANGAEKTISEVNNPKGKFIDRDLYVVIYDLHGKNVAHGGNPKMVGKDLIEMKDVDNKSFMKERVEIAKTKGRGWQDYSFLNPVSKKIEQKSMYVERYEDMIFGCGIYK
jgi:signal transduction histidine kinase